MNKNLLRRTGRTRVLAATAAAAAVAVASVIGLAGISPSYAVDDETNLLAGASVKNSDGLIGLVGVPFEDGAWTYAEESFAVDDVVPASAVDCTAIWDIVLILCDPAPTTDARGSLSQASVHTGFIWAMDDQESTGFVVLDLGQVSTFNSLEVYQMRRSDGQATHAELFVSSAASDTWPTQGDDSWTSVVSGTVADGPDQTETAPLINTAVTTYDFAATSGRYVMLYVQNDGSYDADDYIEAAGAKLFGDEGATPTPSPTPSPEPSVEPTEAPVELNLDLDLAIGDTVAGAEVTISGAGLLPDSPYTVVVRSTPVTIATGFADSSGAFTSTGAMPTGLSAGAHTVTLTGTAADGTELTRVAYLTVSDTGTLTYLSEIAADAGAAEMLASTGFTGAPLGGAALLLLIAGTALVVLRRRHAAA